MRVAGSAAAANPDLYSIHVEINDRRGEEREELAQDEAADDSYSEWAAKLCASAMANGEWQGAEKCRHRGHENRTEAEQACFVNRLDGRETFLGLRLHSEIHHKDGILLDDTDKQNDADQSNEGQLNFEEHQEEERANAGGRNRGKNRDWVNETFVQDAEDDVNGGKRGDDEHEHGGLRILEGLRGALKAAMNRRWHMNLRLRFLNFFHSIAERQRRSEVE